VKMACFEKLKTAQALDRWVAIFKQAFPLAAVDIHEGRVDAEELKRMSVKLPAIFVAALSAPSSSDVGDDTQTYDTVFTAYILTGGQNRDMAGMNMSEAVRIVVKTSYSLIDGVGKATRITWQNVLSTRLIGQGTSLNAVVWRQPVRLGTQSTADEMSTSGIPWPDGVVPEEVYIDGEDEY